MITEKGESDLSEPITLNTAFEQTEIGIFMDEVYGRFFLPFPMSLNVAILRGN